MLLTCPSCSDVFEVAEENLGPRGGAVFQCPRCGKLVAIRDATVAGPSPDATVPFDSGTRAPGDGKKRSAQVLVLDGPGQGEIFLLRERVTTVGGFKGRADVKLRDPKVADSHATIDWDGATFRVRVIAPHDLVIGGKQVAEPTLRGQSVFKVGDTKLMLTVSA
jgi:predicted Zn finger-like uncharacterized protein